VVHVALTVLPQQQERDPRRRNEAARGVLADVSVLCSGLPRSKIEIEQRLGSGMNTSPLKVVDNAIVGYGRTVLQIRGERSDGEE
jgi:hypothetical protein